MSSLSSHSTNWILLILVIGKFTVAGSRIGAKGVRKFVKKNWPALKTIRIGNYSANNNLED